MHINMENTTLIHMSDDQQMMLAMLRGKQHLLVTGPAGSGKSRIIQYWIEHDKPKNLWAVASTGFAAINMSDGNGIMAQTIHSFLHVSAYATPERMRDAGLRTRGEQRHIISALRTLVIDEISMVRADLMDGLDQYLRAARNLPDVPFGGVRLILVGDMSQLPPVVKHGLGRAFGQADRNNMRVGRYVSKWFYSAPGIMQLVDRNQLRLVELTDIHRQKDSDFIQALTDVRRGMFTDQVRNLFNPRAGVTPEPGENTLYFCAYRKDADDFNYEHLKQLPTPLRTSSATYSDTWLEEERNGADLPADRIVFWKVGMPVIMTSNNWETDERTDRRTLLWANGTRGRIIGETAGHPIIRFDNGLEYAVEECETYVCRPYTVKNKDGEYEIRNKPLGLYSQLPFRAGWATTIHKAQGITCDSAYINLGEKDLTNSGQAYTGLSRVKTVKGLYLNRQLRAVDIKIDHRTEMFLNRLRKLNENPDDSSTGIAE